MSKKERHVQCRLTKDVGDGSIIEQISFIPEKYAEIGYTLKLRDDLEKWTDGWVVTATYVTMDSDLVQQQSHGYTKQRGRSDI